MATNRTTSVAANLVAGLDAQHYGRAYADRYAYRREIDRRAEEREFALRESQARRAIRTQARVQAQQKSDGRHMPLWRVAILGAVCGVALAL